MTQLHVLLQVAAAALLGGLIGLEREFAQKEAGLRTHMIVAATAALLVSIGQVLVRDFEVGGLPIRSDPIRLIDAIVTGISFLGAGTIIRSKQGQAVQGLTTAASVLLSASIGIAVGVDLWVIGVGVTVLALLVLRGLVIAEGYMMRRSPTLREKLDDRPESNGDALRDLDD